LARYKERDYATGDNNMRILFVILVSSMVSSAAAQAPDPKQFPETAKVISETKESVDRGSTTTTKRISPMIPCNLNIQACKDRLQSVTKSNAQSYYQAKVQIGDMLYTINGKSGGPGVPFGTFKARIANQYMDIYIVDQNGPYVLGFEIVGAEKIEPQPSPAPRSIMQEKQRPSVAQCRSGLNDLSAIHTDTDMQGLFATMTAADEMKLSTSLTRCVDQHSDVLTASEIARLNVFTYKLDADVLARMWDFIERRHLADAFNDEQEAKRKK
jgi:hypothetical protein